MSIIGIDMDCDIIRYVMEFLLPYLFLSLLTDACVDIVGQGLLILTIRRAQRSSRGIGLKFSQLFEFQPSLNIEHKTERTNAFVTLVFGYSVVALLYQNRAAYGINAFFGKAILGLIQAFCFNWLYFEIDGWNIHRHAIRRHMASSMIWIIIHLPFIMSYVLAGASLSRLVLAHDCMDADPETLTEAYMGRSEAEIEPFLRWFYSAGLGIALFCMSKGHRVESSLVRSTFSLTPIVQASYPLPTCTRSSKVSE